MGLRRELVAMLSDSVERVRTWERHEFDRLSDGRELVLMGAGGLGRRTLHGLRRVSVEPLAFADNASGDNDVVGVPVLTPAAAAAAFGRRATFVVTIWGANRPHRFAHSRQQLTALGCDSVVPFVQLFWKFPDVLLPFYLQDLPSLVVRGREDVLKCFDLWEDDASRAEYVSQVRFRRLADFDGLSGPVAHPQYFAEDLFEWRDDEWIVDGGAYDGDTVRSLLRTHGERFAHVLAFEPDTVSWGRLAEAVEELPSGVRAKVECRHTALASSRGTVYAESTGSAGSVASSETVPGRHAVTAETLDAALERSRPTFIKLDIEGAELDALRGGEKTIRRHAPVLAVCVYHAQDHLWRIPLMLREWRNDYALFLRPHNEEGWDLVCYAVPRARLRGPRS